MTEISYYMDNINFYIALLQPLREPGDEASPALQGTNYHEHFGVD